MSRRYPVADLYEERERDVYRNGNRRTTRDYEELDVELNRRSQQPPDFLREDYGRSSNAGQLVVADRREIDIDTRSRRSSPPARSMRGTSIGRPRAREVEKEEIIIRDDHTTERPRRRHRSLSREDFTFRRSQPELRPRPREVEKDEIDINIRREEDTRSVRSRPREIERDDITIRRSEPRSREVERDEFIIRRGEGDRRPPPRREVDKEEITIRREQSERRPPPPPQSSRGGRESQEIDIDISRTDRGPRGRVRSRSRERITIREQSRPRDRSLPPNLVARETEEFVIRRRKPPSPSPSPSPPRRFERESITIRRTERSPSPPPPAPAPELPPPPVLAPIVRPPIHQEIHQEIITHHRHIDHGVERARSLSPPAIREPTPPKEKVDSLEIDIRRRKGGKDEDINIDIDRRSRSRSRQPHRHSVPSLEVSRPRSLDPPRRRFYEDDVESEAEYYNRKALERGYPGEAFNGATKDWSIVDVPPGTERVKMDGAGGGSQEISWQRYNGVRRSKFITGDREYETPFGAPAPVDDRRMVPAGPPSRRPTDMWTEITKDLVIKEAIEHMGYDYEETEFFFYVMEYLKYEDVLQLVEISDDIRRARRRRIREIEWERDELNSRRSIDDRGYYDREVVIDRTVRERRY